MDAAVSVIDAANRLASIVRPFDAAIVRWRCHCVQGWPEPSGYSIVLLMATITVKLDKQRAKLLTQLARRRKMTKSDIIRS